MWYRILPNILNMSLTGSIVILFVLLARLALKRAPRIFSYALWGVVLFRLLCPVALTSDFSLMGLTRYVDVRTSTHTTSAEYIPSDLVESVVAPQWQIQYLTGATAPDSHGQIDPEYVLENEAQLPLLSPDLPAHSNADSSEDTSERLLPSRFGDASPSPLATPITIATSLWLTGILALVGYSLHSLHTLRRQLVGAIPLRDMSLSNEERTQPTHVYLADHITTPFVLGVLRPRIYLPSSLTQEQQSYILLHEQHHIRRLDHVCKLLAYAALCLHWFNPLVWLAFFLSGKDMEMSCDEAVLRQMGDGIRADYSASLLSLATGHRILAGAPLAFGEGDTKDRIRHVLDHKKPRTWVVLTALVLCGILALALMTNPRQKPSFTSARYRVDRILYDAPQYSFTYTRDTAPQFTITSDYVLMSRSGIDDTATWANMGGLYPVDYSRQELYSLFDPLYCTAHEQLDQVAIIYRAEPFNVSAKLFFLVMQTYDGDILLAQGYGEELTGHVRWLFELEKQSGSYDIYAMQEALEQQYGADTQYFALYECDNDPGVILLGFQVGTGSAKGPSAIGYAYFRYDTNQEDYILYHSDVMPYSLTGLHTIELTQDEGYDANLQIILSSRDDMAAIRVSSLLAATQTFQLEKEVPVAGEPTMLIFECPDAMTLNNLHIEYIYDWSNEWMDRQEIALPYGPYCMMPENSEDPYPFIRLHLQEDRTFTFVYDPLSSYSNYGHYTIENDILTAITDDGRYQFCFEILDEETLIFLAAMSSDVTPTDERLVEPVKDGSVFQLITYNYKFVVPANDSTANGS